VEILFALNRHLNNRSSGGEKQLAHGPILPGLGVKAIEALRGLQEIKYAVLQQKSRWFHTSSLVRRSRDPPGSER